MEDIQVPSFPVPNLIHKPRIPSPSEAGLIQRMLLSVRTKMSRIDDEIKRPQDVVKRQQETMQELLSVRDGLSKYTKESEAILSPIDRFPSELLSEAFQLLLPP